MKSLSVTIVTIALITGIASSVYGQQRQGDTGGDVKSNVLKQREESARKAQEADKAYRETISKTGSASEGAFDPWAKIRTAPTTPAPKR